MPCSATTLIGQVGSGLHVAQNAGGMMMGSGGMRGMGNKGWVEILV